MAKARTAGPVLTVEALREWLATQDGAERYNYGSLPDCLIARFVKSQGFDDVEAAGSFVVVDDVLYDLPGILNDIAVNGPYTYSAALKRAEGGA